MSDLAIQAENLSKAYRIGLKEQQHETMLGALVAWVKAPLANFRSVRSLSKFDDVNLADRRSKMADSLSSNFQLPTPIPSSPSDIFWALKDVSFEVKHGEAVGIIGRNGAGKSTLLKILCRIAEPTSGRARIYGRVASLLEVGTGFHPDLTGRENVYLNGTILGMKKREVEARFDEIVAFSGVEKFIDTPVKRYSSGMRVRLAFSVAAHLEPEILIIDEVLAVGDAEFQKKCLGKLREVAGGGRTVLFVSHNMTAIANLCGLAMTLENGSSLGLGPAEQIVRDYLRSSKARMALSARQMPHDAVITMQAIEVKQDGRTAGTFVTDRPISVCIRYRLGQPVGGLRIGFDLCNAEDDSVLWRTFDDDSETSEIFRPAPADYEAVCIIPGNLLAPHNYHIKLLIGIHQVRWISRGEVVLEVTIEKLAGVNRQYADSRPGILMPQLAWWTSRQP